MSNETRVFVCTGDWCVWIWWYGREMLLPRVCIVLDPADEMIFALSLL
jgi:hypothetical protein